VGSWQGELPFLNFSLSGNFLILGNLSNFRPKIQNLGLKCPIFSKFDCKIEILSTHNVLICLKLICSCQPENYNFLPLVLFWPTTPLVASEKNGSHCGHYTFYYCSVQNAFYTKQFFIFWEIILGRVPWARHHYLLTRCIQTDNDLILYSFTTAITTRNPYSARYHLYLADNCESIVSNIKRNSTLTVTGRQLLTDNSDVSSLVFLDSRSSITYNNTRKVSTVSCWSDCMCSDCTSRKMVLTLFSRSFWTLVASFLTPPCFYSPFTSPICCLSRFLRLESFPLSCFLPYGQFPLIQREGLGSAVTFPTTPQRGGGMLRTIPDLNYANSLEPLKKAFPLAPLLWWSICPN